MKISKYLMQSSAIKFPKIKINSIKRNKKVKDVYLICASSKGGYLFEIIQGKFLSDKYNLDYLVGLTTSKEEATKYVCILVDGLYNTKIYTCEGLKTE